MQAQGATFVPTGGYLLWGGGSSQQCQQLAQTPNHPLATSSASLQGALVTGTSAQRAGTEQDGAVLPICCSVSALAHSPPSQPLLTLCIPLTNPGCSPPPTEASHHAGCPGKDGLGPAACLDEDKWGCADQQHVWAVHHIPLDEL